MRRLDIRNRISGVTGTPHTDGTVLWVEDSHLQNHANIEIGTNATVGANAEDLTDRRWAFNRVTMVVAPASVPYASGNVVLRYKATPTVNLIALVRDISHRQRADLLHATGRGLPGAPRHLPSRGVSQPHRRARGRTD